jgi:phosphoketolase
VTAESITGERRAANYLSVGQIYPLDKPLLREPLRLSKVVQNAVIGADNSFTGGAIGAITLVAIDTALNQLIARNRWARTPSGLRPGSRRDRAPSARARQRRGVT